MNGSFSFVCALAPEQAFAETDNPLGEPRNPQKKQPAVFNNQDQRPPARTPPRAAFEACEGKKEGDSCTFRSQQDILNGECRTNFETEFACRPHRGAPPSGSVQESKPVRRTEPRSLSQPEPGTPPKADREPDKKVEHPQPPQSPPTGLYEKPERYLGSLGSYFFVAVMAAGLTWFGFFRYSTLPLRRLRKVTQQLAGGYLSARVGEGLVHRKNEVIELGRDVDRMAERIESLVGAHQRLIRDVSHELRSPLARLNVALELARQSAGPAHTAPFDRIEREAERLNELIGQLLMLTRLENESGMTERAEFDISAMIAEIAQDVDFEARSNDRGVVLSACEPLVINGNRELLRQALENLVRNAVRYTAAGTTVEISLCRKESGGCGRAHIDVRDHGPGVPESELINIFRPFYRINDARERQSGGAGVGLAISERAVHLHGGNLRAFNALDTGLIMEMELPLTVVIIS